MHTGFVTGPSLITFNTTFVYLISSAFPFLDEICSPFMLFVWFVTNLNLFFFFHFDQDKGIAQWGGKEVGFLR